MQDKMKIGIVGCGNICPAYFGGAKNTDLLEVKACADLIMEKAQAAAEKYDCQAVTVEELLADSEIELVVNITTPDAHVEVDLQVLEAGKHIYSEKPFGITVEDAQKVIDLASEKGLKVGCAPDTFLGAGGQTARKLIDEGAIGEPIAATALLWNHGHENWHPSPAFFYDIGGGPMLDMGPYYVTALVNLIGPVTRVAGMTKKTFSERIATSEGAKGQRLPVRVSTHLTGTLEFANGAIVTMITSFDMWKASLPRIEVHGTEGSMQVPDPNTFRGPVKVGRNKNDEWTDVPLAFPENARMIGVVDMVKAIRTGRPYRAAGAMAFHVLEVMTAFDKSSETGQHIEIESTVERPAPFPVGLDEWEVD